MDDFSIFSDSFDVCLKNLRKVFIQCIETNLVLSCEKSYFMVTKGIVLGPIISDKGIKVNETKVETIFTLPLPID